MIAVAFALIVWVWALLEGAWTLPETPAPGTLALPTGLVLLAGHAGAVAELFATDADGEPLGAAVLVAGIALRLWSIRALGDAFRTAPAPKRIVRSGPYRWLRHPSEIGLVVAAAGAAVMLDSRIALVCTALLVPLSIVRCRREDYFVMRASPPR